LKTLEEGGYTIPDWQSIAEAMLRIYQRTHHGYVMPSIPKDIRVTEKVEGNQLRLIYADPKMRKEISRRAIEWSKQFDIEDCVSKTENVSVRAEDLELSSNSERVAWSAWFLKSWFPKTHDSDQRPCEGP